MLGTWGRSRELDVEVSVVSDCGPPIVSRWVAKRESHTVDVAGADDCQSSVHPIVDMAWPPLSSFFSRVKSQ